jgi:HemY protein
MARAVFIFILAALIAGFVVWVVSYPGWVTADWLGYRFEAPMSVTVLALTALFVILYFSLRLLHAIASGPDAYRRYSEKRQSRRANEALTQGLAAAAAGDAHLAHRQAARAGRLAKDGPLAQVLALEAAMLEERHKDVAALAPTLLNHPETELLGRRALFDLARKSHNRTAEVDHAEAAFETHPAAGWAAEALLADAIRAADWDRARSILARAGKAGSFANGRVGKIKAALLLAEAQDVARHGDTGKAAALARKAWDADESLTAAAVLRAELLAGAGKPKAARDFAERVWSVAPHPALARIVMTPGPDETQDAVLARVRDLVKQNPDHMESRLALTEAAIAARNIDGARAALKPLIEAGGSARAFALMAALDRAEHGAAADPEEWTRLALDAPRDAVWVCGACGYRSTDWHGACPRCAGVAAAYWATHEEPVTEAPPAPVVSEPTAERVKPAAPATPAAPAAAPATAVADAAAVEPEPDTDDVPAEPPHLPDDPGTDDEADGPREW